MKFDDTPTIVDFQSCQEELTRRQIILDDGNNFQNTPLPNGSIFHSLPNAFVTDTQGTDVFQGGDSITDLTGVLHWSFASFSGTDAWRVRSTASTPVKFDVDNPRPTAPGTVSGNIQVASVNVLNYFTTLDNGTNDGTVNGLDLHRESRINELLC